MTSIERFGLQPRVGGQLRWKKRPGRMIRRVEYRQHRDGGQQKRSLLDDLTVWCIERRGADPVLPRALIAAWIVWVILCSLFHSLFASTKSHRLVIHAVN